MSIKEEIHKAIADTVSGIVGGTIATYGSYLLVEMHSTFWLLPLAWFTAGTVLRVGVLYSVLKLWRQYTKSPYSYLLEIEEEFGNGRSGQ